MKYLLFILLVVFSLILTGCGIPEEQYTDVVQQRDAALEKANSLEGDLSDINAEVTQLKQDTVALSSQLEKLETDLEAANGRLKDKEAENIALTIDLATIQKVYPAKDFESTTELLYWLRLNDISEREVTTSVSNWYRAALELQEAAAKDGYLVSVDIDYEASEDAYYVFCVTIIDGEVWAWDPETDEIYHVEWLGKVK